MITNAKVDVEKSDGRNNFGLWQSNMKDAMYMLRFGFGFERNKTR